MKNTLFLLLVLCITTTLPAAEKRAFTLDDLYRLKSISSLEVSPDGTGMLFVVTGFNLKKAEKDSNIWRMNLKTGTTQQLTFNKASDYSPVWSPDGRFIYFVSTRKEGAQLWKMSSSGGEAQKMTSFSTGINSPEVLPDGSAILFESTVFPEAGADSEANRKLEDQLEKGPTQAHTATELLYRHWTEFRNWKYTHIFKLDTSDDSISEVTRGREDFPAYGGSYAVSPDGKTVCIVINPDKHKETSTNSDLYLLDLKTGKGANLTVSNPAYDGDPSFSPDGRYIAYRMQKVPGYESDRFRLCVYDLKKHSTRVLTESIDNWVTDFRWAKDSRSLYFTVPEKGRTPVYQIDLKNLSIQKVLDSSFVREFKVLRDGTLVFTRSSVGAPYEVWKFRPNHMKEPVRETSFNQKVADEVDIRPAESVWVDGAAGSKIQLFIVKPHNFDPAKKYPLILNVHGGPQYMWADSFRGDWQVYPGSGYVVAFPNPHGSTGYGQDFTAAISGDYDGKVMTDLENVTNYLAALPYVDADRMGVMGWSWGGYAMMWLEGHNKHFKAIASMMGIFDLQSMYYATEELWFPEWDNGGTPWENPEYYRRASPSTYVKNFKTPCLVITGERDYRVPYTQSVQFFTALQKMNVPSRLIIFKNDGHWPDTVKSMPVYYNAHLEWFHKYLGGAKAPYSTDKMIRNQAFEEK